MNDFAATSSSRRRGIVELEFLERVDPAPQRQILTYLRLAGMKLGYLLNFGEVLMKHSITRIVCGE